MPGGPTPATRSSRMRCMPWCSRNPEKYWRKIARTGQNQRDDNISLRCQGLHNLLAFGCAPRTKNYPEKYQNDGICSLFLLSEVNQHQGVPVSPSNDTEKTHPETCSFNWTWWLNPVSPTWRWRTEWRGKRQVWKLSCLFCLLLF